MAKAPEPPAQADAASAGPSHVVETQDEVFRFLAASATHGLDREIKRIDTHGAAVFLAGTRAYKVKRAVLFPFMDFSTLEKRRQACEAEIRINRPDAPDIYLGVLPITRSDGALHLDGPGDVVEWVVQMRRFDEGMTLDRVIERDGLSPDLLARMAAAVAASHARAPIRKSTDFATALASLIDENGESLGETPEIFDPAHVAALTESSRIAIKRHGDLLRRRAIEGSVRRCHGDLHLRNLVLVNGRPVLFDAIEFSEALATTDVLYDLAFLLMDIAERGLPFEANHLLNRYLYECHHGNHLVALAALPLFISVRAAIRAKVIAAGLGHLGSDEQPGAIADARRYLAFAETALAPVPPRLVAVGGLSGTGKSTLAARLAPSMGSLPGAVHLRSDIERKRLRGVPEFEPLPAAAYDRSITEAIYETLRRKAETVLCAGQSVIIDAVHQTTEQREALTRLAVRLGVAFTGLWLDAPLAVLVERVERRESDASDADAGVIAVQVRHPIGRLDWHKIDADRNLEEVLTHARAELAKDA